MSISNLLSNEEISALLNSRQSSASYRTFGNTADQKVVEPLNFMHASKKDGAHSASFNAGNERFVLNVSAALTRFLQQKVRIEPIEPRLMSYTDYLSMLEQPSILGLVTLKVSPYQLLINVKQQLLYQVINILFGGSAARDKGNYQEFGKIDLRISQRMVELIFESLAVSWKEVAPIEAEQIEMILKPNTITSLTPQHIMLVTSYILTINEIKAELQLVFDADMLEDSRLGLTGGNQNKIDSVEDKRWKDKLRESVYDVALPAIAAFPSVELKLAELSRLKEGDVIFLENHQIVDVHVAGLKIYNAQCGVAEGARVVHIIDSGSR